MGDIKKLVEQGDKLFGDRFPVLSLWQTLAENFYPERADFTDVRNLGEEFADHLVSSYPVIARRDLANSLSSMLRRDSWFSLTAPEMVEGDVQGQRWLEWATKQQRKLMYARESGFKRATKEGDNDFASFGQAAISVELNRNRTGLLYRCWHLRDIAWSENEAGQVDTFHRKWNPRVVDLANMFGEDKLSNAAKQLLQKEPLRQIECRHIVIPSENFDESVKEPYTSVYVEVGHNESLEQTGLNHKFYCLPRFQTVSGSQYAHSPASIAALPDARLVQAMTHTLLDAGERFTNPPLLGVQEAIRSDIQTFAGGITWVDQEYDERLGEVLRPLTQDKSGMNLGFELRGDTQAMIAEAFYLSKLTLPISQDMTAYEVSQRMQEFIRQTLPLFEPMEDEYNGQLCDMTFDLALSNGLLGSPMDIPKSLGSEVEFNFTSPISEAVERDKGSRFVEVKDMLSAAAEIDPAATVNVDINEALRDALLGIGAPATWLLDETEVAQAQQQKMLEQVAQVAVSGQ